MMGKKEDFINVSYIYPQLQQEWQKTVCDDDVEFLECECALMAGLEKSISFEKVYSIIEKQNYTNILLSVLLGNVIYFSKNNGPEFGEWVIKNKNPEFGGDETIEYLQNLKARNARFNAEITDGKTE